MGMGQAYISLMGNTHPYIVLFGQGSKLPGETVSLYMTPDPSTWIPGGPHEAPRLVAGSVKKKIVPPKIFIL